MILTLLHMAFGIEVKLQQSSPVMVSRYGTFILASLRTRNLYVCFTDTVGHKIRV